MSDRPNYNDAMRHQVEADLVCPSCTTANRVGASFRIHLGRDWRADCSCCNFVWKVEPPSVNQGAVR